MENRFNGQGKLSLKVKLLLMTSAIMTTAIFVISYIFYSNAYKQTAYLLQKQALAIAKSASALVDGDQFQRLSESLDKEDEYYKEILGKFSHLNDDLQEGMLYAYIDNDEKSYTYIIDGSGTVDIGFRQQKQDFSMEAAQSLKDGRSYICKPYYVKTFDKHYISAFVPIFNSQKEVVGVIEYDYEGAELSAELRRMNIIIMIISVVFIAFVLIMNYFILIKLFRPIDNLIDSIAVVADGDLTIELNTARPDEIGKINIALNETIHRIHSVIRKIKQSSEKVTIASKSILVSSRDASEVYEELAISTSGISDVIQKQASEARGMQRRIDQLYQGTKNIEQEINYINEKAVRIYEDGRKRLGSQEANEHLMKNVARIYQVMMELSQYVHQSQGITKSILGVSNKTNKLTLKVVKEAVSKEHEHLAQVAEEVGELTKQSDEAVNQIEEIINFIVKQVDMIFAAIKENMASIQKEEAEASADEELRMLTKEYNDLCQQICKIKGYTSRMDAEIGCMSDSLKEIEQVSLSVDVSTASLLAITQEQVATSEEFKAMAELLRQQAKKLDESISKFTI